MQRVTFRSESNNERKSKEMKRLTIAVFVAAIVGMVPLTSQQAQALPSFARQTGQSCGACHTDFPQLTPFGRRFKLGGYTLGGGRNTEEYRRVFGSDAWVPPISVMGQVTLEQTKRGQGGNPGDPGTPTDFLSTLSVPQGSMFFGGAITNELGDGSAEK